MIKTIEWTDEGVVMIDQRRLPTHELYPIFKTHDEVAIAIEDMVAILTEIVGPSDDIPVVCRTVMISAARRPSALHTLLHFNVLDHQMREST